jgi:hypothetical protein
MKFVQIICTIYSKSPIQMPLYARIRAEQNVQQVQISRIFLASRARSARLLSETLYILYEVQKYLLPEVPQYLRAPPFMITNPII